MEWVSAENGAVPRYAIAGGSRAYSGEVLYVARGTVHDDTWDPGEGVVPGRLLPSLGQASLPWLGKEHFTTKYQVLTNPYYSDSANLFWVKCAGKKMPEGAVKGGNDPNGYDVYIGRVEHPLGSGHFVPGKVYFGYGKCYITYDGKEVSFTEYYVLVQQS